MPTLISGSTGVNKITDGTIVDADINASAAIAGSKISGSFGKVLQVVSKADISRVTISSSSGSTYTAHYGLAITPSATSSKILIMVCQPTRIEGTSVNLMRGSLKLERGSTDIWNTSNFGEHIHVRNADNEVDMTQYIQYLDSPSTTSATTYNVSARLDTGANFFLWESAYGANMVLMEIGA